MARIYSIEAARGLAACMVVAYHVVDHLHQRGAEVSFGSWFKFGHAGVDFFFVLSGFIIYFAHHADVGKAWLTSRFIWRRFVRIYPLFWVAMLMTVCAALLLKHREVPDVTVLISDALLLPSLNGHVLSVAWTLRHEIFFYLIFAVAIWRAPLGHALLGIWLSALVAVCFVMPNWPESLSLLRFVLSPYNLQFFFGLIAARLVIRGWVPESPIWGALGAAVFIAYAVAENFGAVDGHGIEARWVYGLSAAMLVVGMATYGKASHMKGVMSFLGRASYSIYLFHFIALGTLFQFLQYVGWFQRLNVGLMFAGYLLFAITLGWGVSRWLEFPLIKLIYRLRWCQIRFA